METGTANGTPGQAACQPCARGSVPTSNRTSCVACPSGRSAALVGSSVNVQHVLQEHTHTTMGRWEIQRCVSSVQPDSIRARLSHPVVTRHVCSQHTRTDMHRLCAWNGHTRSSVRWCCHLYIVSGWHITGEWQISLVFHVTCSSTCHGISIASQCVSQ